MKWRAAALAWTLFAYGPAWSQAERSVLEPPDSLACLEPSAAARGVPEFPRALLNARQSATLEVELAFNAADGAPEVNVLRNSGSKGFESPVREFVSRYRMPCLPAGQRWTLRQEFVFDPSDRRPVYWFDPTSEDRARTRVARACLTRVEGAPKLEYPARALRAEVSGNVFVRLRFESPSAPPKATIIEGAQFRDLAGAVLDYVSAFRLPCYGGVPTTVTNEYRFRFEGDAITRLNDMTLRGLLRFVKGLDKATVYFDFGRMGCPFDLRVTLWQPHSANDVGEVGAVHPERRHFIEWMQRQQLDLDARTQNKVLGGSLTVSVPCGVLDLGNSGGGGASQ